MSYQSAAIIKIVNYDDDGVEKDDDKDDNDDGGDEENYKIWKLVPLLHAIDKPRKRAVCDLAAV